ncbi:hypothetical protein [Rhodococcus pyridinivorans]|uniref:hypothetical protein n=1 Tax=Rhodococcus pyridinivorans TaxID=103816 RepID=UPI000A4C453C|nr:hypothetical protein [Rhodococcus pyridinivorans]
MKTSACTRPRDHLRLFLPTRTPGGSDDWHEITAGDKPAVCVQAPDLGYAQQLYLRHRAALRREGHGPDDVSFIVDVAVLISDCARAARRAWRERADDDSFGQMGLRYIGTPAGLRGLLDDIYSAQVADGVSLSALAGYNTIDEIISAVDAREAMPLPAWSVSSR